MVLLAEAEPATKKAKTEEVVEEAVEKKSTKVEPAPELETDAVADKSPKIKEKVGFLVQDTTMNVADSTFGSMLTCLTDGGLQYLLGGARASVGMKSGRYMFEVNVVELMNQKQDQATVTGKVPQPRNFFRVGLSTAGSSLLIGEDEESICFDAEGSFIHNKKKTSVGAKFERCMTVCILVNLDAKSPNANTVSVFKDGERVCQPQALPESLKGKALFPTLTYRNVTVHYNFGAVASSPLPFTCPMLQAASAKDVVVSKEEAPKDGKYTALFPVCLPDEGGFQWLDNWLKANPGYTELSDRAILDWAQKSGVARLKPYSQKVCNDKPEMGFGLPLMDDKSIQKMMATTAWMQKRNFVVMEVNANLIKDDRSKLLTSFADFKKVAMVVTGPPPKAFQQLTQDAVLSDKQDVANAEFKKKMEDDRKRKVVEKAKQAKEKAAKKAEKVAKKVREEKNKQLQEAMKKKAEDMKKAVAEKKKKAEEEKKAAAVAAGGAEATEEVAEEAKEEEDAKMEEEEVKEEKEEIKEESEESEAEPLEEEEADADPPTVELTDEEKKLVFKACSTPDVTSATLNAAFSKYTLPEKADGFDEITYEWANATKSAEHISAWRQDKKITARIEDLVPGDWFDGKQKEWSKFLTLCKQKQNDYKAAVAKRAADKLAREKAKQMKELKKKAAEKAKKDAKEKAVQAAKAKKEKLAAEKATKAEERQKKIDAGEEVAEEEAEEPEKEEAVPMEVEEEEKAESEEEPLSEDELVDLESVDVFGAEDIMEIGGKPKQPLFAQFNFEDWALMSLHFELNLLVHAFKKDVKDAERAVIHEDNIGFYYQKYYRKGLNPAFFGVKTTTDLLKFYDGTLTITSQKVLETFLPLDFEQLNMFVLLAETARRDRLRRIDLGEEGAQIKMPQSVTGGAVAISGVSTGQMGAIQNFAAQRAAILGGGVVRPPYQPMGVRPPMPYKGAPMGGKGAWGPAVAPMGKGAWGPARPAYSPYGAPSGPYGAPPGYKGGW